MPAEHSNGTLLALVGMGVTWLVGAVGSHVSIRSHVKTVDEREAEHHSDTKELIAAMDKRQRESMAAMDKRHQESTAQTSKSFNYISKRLDTLAGSKGD